MCRQHFIYRLKLEPEEEATKMSAKVCWLYLNYSPLGVSQFVLGSYFILTYLKAINSGNIQFVIPLGSEICDFGFSIMVRVKAAESKIVLLLFAFNLLPLFSFGSKNPLENHQILRSSKM